MDEDPVDAELLPTPASACGGISLVGLDPATTAVLSALDRAARWHLVSGPPSGSAACGR
ncbi:hypothetical protein [Kitasatospora sp. NPDC089509]|uniref:hypothetical protein n=1 Tax=Kitasatospora sp. NPDC089509 TaxID=3364079 RepID=UPI003823CC88